MLRSVHRKKALKAYGIVVIDTEISIKGATLMNKSDLIAALATKENLTERQTTDIINLIFNGFRDTLKNGNRIEIRGFGSFSVREYKSYEGRNPKTGKNIDVKPKKLPFFKVGKELKAMVDAKVNACHER
jgi:integration host factor subunit beta